MSATYTISELTWEWARESITSEIEWLLDDPSCLEEEPERVETLKAVALDLDMDIIEIINTHGTAIEIERLLPYFNEDKGEEA